MPDGERPRERLLLCGAPALKDSELLAILLRTGHKGRSAVVLAEQLLQAYGGSLVRLAEAEVGELAALPGMGQVKAIGLKAAFALARRLSEQGRRSGLVKISSPLEVAALFRERSRLMSQEEFHVLLLDTKNVLLAEQMVTRGLVDRSPVHPREVFRKAIRESCSRVILVHNHPSGDPTPSANDIASTKLLVDAGRVVGIEVVDHIIVGCRPAEAGADYVSFRELGLMPPAKEAPPR